MAPKPGCVGILGPLSLVLLIGLPAGAMADGYKTLRYEDPAPGPEQDAAPFKQIVLADDPSLTLSLGGQLRVRAEVWENFGFAEDNDDEFLLGRVFAHADLRAGDALRLFVEGKFADTTSRDLPGGKRALDTDTAALQNAFLDLIWPGDEALTLRLGRQELLYGKQRLISPLDWANTRRTFEGVRLLTACADWRVDAFATRLVPVDKYDFNEGDSDIGFFGAYAHHAVAEQPIQYDLYGLYLDRDAAAFSGVAGKEERYTAGARVWGRCPFDLLDYEIEGGYQFGKHARRDIGAWFIASQLALPFEETAMKPRIYLGYDHASGDSDPDDDEVGTFNQLFPLGHAYHGYIDAIGRQNLIDFSQGLSLWPAETLLLKVEHHLFWRAETDDAVYNAGGGVLRPGDAGEDRAIGNELDVFAKLAFSPQVVALLGYSHFFAGDFIDETAASEDIDFGYASVQYTF